MANGRGAGRSKRETGRDPGPFVALPLSVLDCPGYAALSHPARALLLEVARQCKGDDNGRLLLSRVYLAGRGWKSADVIQRAKVELIKAEFIFETVRGHRPNKASAGSKQRRGQLFLRAGSACLMSPETLVLAYSQEPA